MTGLATQNALKKNFNPLFSLNYSATHKASHNLVYVLDALDAFQKKLVKKIEVKGFEIKNLRGTNRYLYVEEIVLDNKKPPRARLELEVKHKGGIKRERTRPLGAGDNLYDESKGLTEYKGLSITEVDPFRGVVTFSDGTVLAPGNASGNISENDIRRIQIRETIQSHFDKEEMLFKQGIKCLSLFFIDEVAKYRQYDESGDEQPGEYSEVFEQEYNLALNERLSLFPSPYQAYLRNITTTATHNGYFSIDKQGGKERVVDSKVKRGNEFSDDISAYDLILKNKERLLSFEEPTRFIFSHSALREGWDNPNVFQICALKHSDSATAKRQEVGRGLRLCVNQLGNRQDIDVCGESFVHDINTLTVIASESYADFVSDLQSKIREDLYERPIKVGVEYFAQKTLNGEAHTITEQEARAIYHYLAKNDYVNDKGGVTSEYHAAVEGGRLAPVKEELAPLASGIHMLVQAVFDPSILEKMILDGHDTKLRDNPFDDNFYKQEFKDLWNAINARYAYMVDFDSAELIEKSTAALNASLHVAKLQYTLTEGVQTGAEFDVSRTRTQTLEQAQDTSVRYDLIGKIAEGTTLTRRSVAAILKGLSPIKLDMFLSNPEEFIQKTVDEVNRQKAAVVVEHISYQPSAEKPYEQEIFNMSKSSQEYAKAYQAKKAIQDYVFTDGLTENSVERKFAKDMDAADEVVVYAKLPRGPKGFYIPTPVGNYSPDWAIAFKRGAVKHIFFIAETKGSMDSLNLRPIEQAKIFCAKKLFNEISTTGVKYHDIDSYKNLLDVIQTL